MATIDMQHIFDTCTHFQVSAHGISFYTSDKCEHCGEAVHMQETAWIRFDGVTIEQSRQVALGEQMSEITGEPNESNYAENTPSNECCGECWCSEFDEE